MPTIYVWPEELLEPAECRFNLSPVSRSGGVSFGAVEPVTRTDLGFWKGELVDVPLFEQDQLRTFDALGELLAGRSGLISVPAWKFDTAPFASGGVEPDILVPHEDGSSFEDGTLYRQGSIAIRMAAPAGIGERIIQIELVKGEADLAGIRFSYNHALYKTGKVLSISGNVWTVTISPTIRLPLPLNAELEVTLPRCLCHLEQDDGMSNGINADGFEKVTIAFVEATDYWNNVAMEVII